MRWTLHNETDYLFGHLSYDGPPIQPDERVDVVSASFTDEDVERVAEALYIADVDDRARVPWGGLTDIERVGYRDLARTAISAYLER